MTFKTGFYALLMTAVMGSSFAAEVTFSKERDIDLAVNALMKEQGGVGTAVVVIKDGVPIFMKGYGWANLEHMVPVTPDTVFQSGSVGKMFTATAIMMLVRDGKISLDDKLSKFYPKGPKYWQAVTIQHLLSHRGGISDITGAGGAREMDWSKEDASAKYSDFILEEFTSAQYTALIGDGEKMFEPGTDYRYSNEAYELLGFIIQKVSGQFYGDFLKDNLFAKIGMKTTQVNVNSHIIPNRAQSYERVGEDLTHAAPVSHFQNQSAAGSLLFTLKDLVHWDIALDEAEILPRTYLDQMYQGVPYPDGSVGINNYGFGWETKYVRGHRVVMHGGSWQGFKTCLSRYRDDGLTVAVLSNAGSVDSCRITTAVAGLFNPDYRAYTPLADQSMTSKMKKITLDYLQGNMSNSLFRAPAGPVLSDAQVNRMAHQVSFNPGDVFELVAKYSTGGYTGYTFRMRDEKTGNSKLVIYEFGQDGKIEKMFFQAE